MCAHGRCPCLAAVASAPDQPAPPSSLHWLLLTSAVWNRETRIMKFFCSFADPGNASFIWPCSRGLLCEAGLRTLRDRGVRVPRARQCQARAYSSTWANPPTPAGVTVRGDNYRTFIDSSVISRVFLGYTVLYFCLSCVLRLGLNNMQLIRGWLVVGFFFPNVKCPYWILLLLICYHPWASSSEMQLSSQMTSRAANCQPTAAV